MRRNIMVGLAPLALGMAALSGAAGAQSLPLTMKQAVDLALEPEGSVRLQMAIEAIEQARSRSGQARAALLPQVDAAVTRDNRTVNLRAFGVNFDIPGTPFQTPGLVGPFPVFDARASGSQSVFNFSSIRRYQASRGGVRTAREESDATRDQVAAQVAKAYLAALRAQARIEASQANVRLAEELLNLAKNQRDAGTGTGMDVTRAMVQLANERQVLLVAENERTRAHLELKRAMDMRLDTPLELTERLEYHAVDPMEPEAAIRQALEARPDWKAQRQREQTAGLNYSASKWERLPSVAAFGNYGAIGSGIDNSFPTRTYGLRLQVPVFDGGRLDAQRAEAASLRRQESIRTADLKLRIELETRLALDALRSAREQAEVAAEGLELAEEELGRAERRFSAGVAPGIEITDAQNRLARARENRIAALFNYESARLDLGQALGNIRQTIQQAARQ
ncbi:MAG: TolC family protein [Bryobacteraceae bacterium]|nr:TolC family protein [Bryobacteraceae bacterium]